MNNENIPEIELDNNYFFTGETDENGKIIFKWRQRCDNNTNDFSEDSIANPVNTPVSDTYSSIRTNTTVRSISMTQSYQSNVSNIEVIWLDININNDEDCLDTQAKLNALIEFSQIFSNSDECIDYIVSMKDRPVILITSGSIGQYLVPLICDISQIICIYIFCENLNIHTIWAQNYVKVCGIFCNKDTLFWKLIQDLESFETSFTIFNAANVEDARHETSIKNCKAEHQSMIWYQLIIEALLRMDDTSIEKTEMLEECRKYYIHDKIEYAKIIEFENTFTVNDAIRWYTRDSFLYRLLNKALRTQDVPFIYKFRFFLKALYNQLAHVYNTETVHLQPIREVYRGQMLRIEELQKLKDSIGGTVSFHSFLSATKDKNVAVVFAGNGRGRPFFESVVFCIEIFWEFHPYIETTLRIMNQAGIDAKPFADISNYTYFHGEQEILFAMESVFKIFSVKLIDSIWYVKCKFYPGGNGNFMNDEISNWNLMLTCNPRVDVIGDFLLELGDYESAIYFYMLSADDQFDDLSIAWADYKLGRLYMRKDEFDVALRYLQKAENLMLVNVSLTDFWLKNIFETIGDTYIKRAQQESNPQKDYELAIVNYKKALNTVLEKRSNKQSQRSSKFEVCQAIMGSSDEEIMRAEISYKLFKAYCKIDDHPNGECFGEIFLTILHSNSTYKYKISEQNTFSVSAVGADSRTANTLKARKILFTGVIYAVEGAIIPNCADMCKRCYEFVQLTNDKEKKMICCKFVTDMCLPLYPSLYDILLFSHKYNLLIDSEYKDDYLSFFICQEKVINIELSNMPSSFSEYIRTCIMLAHLEIILERRPKFEEESDELFVIQMMDFHTAAWIKRQDFCVTKLSAEQNQDIDFSLDYDDNFVFAKNYPYYQRPLKSTSDAHEMLTLYENQIKLLLKMDLNKATLTSPYRNIARLYGYMSEYSTALEYYERCLDIAYTSMPSNQSYLKRTFTLIENEIIQLYLTKNAFSHAIQLMELCLRFLQKYDVSNYLQLATIYAQLSDIYLKQENYNLCVEYTKQELIHLQSIKPTDDSRILRCQEKIKNIQKKFLS